MPSRSTRPVAALALASVLIAVATQPLLGQTTPEGTDGGTSAGFLWTMSPASPAFDDAMIVADLAVAPDGMAVIVGSVVANGLADAAAWWSADGETWEQGTLPLKRAWRGLLAGGSVLDGVIAAPSGLVAVGGGLYGQPPGLVASSLDGQTWTPQLGDEPVHYADIASMGTGFITVGKEARRRGSFPEAWDAADIDPGTWDAVRIADVGQATHIQVAPDGTRVSAGYVVNRRGSPVASPVWRSVDGAEWTAIEPQERPGGRITGLAWTPVGFLLAFHEGPVWISADGIEWQRTLEVSEGPVSAVGAIGDDVVAFGTDRMWLSSDGITWSEVMEPAFEGYSISSLSQLSDGRVLLAGSKVVPNRLEIDVATFVGTRLPQS
jgi:hypothetical protein